MFYEGKYYFPLFRYYFSSFYFYKPLDIFYNTLGVCLPFLDLGPLFYQKRCAIFLCWALWALFYLYLPILHLCARLNPASDGPMNISMQKEVVTIANYENDLLNLKRERDPLPNWQFDLKYMNPYAKLSLVVDEYIARKQHIEIVKNLKQEDTSSAHTPFWMEEENKRDRIATLKEKREKNYYLFMLKIEKKRCIFDIVLHFFVKRRAMKKKLKSLQHTFDPL